MLSWVRMPGIEQRVQVVLVSPGDVVDERGVVKAAVDELNRGIAADRGCRLSLWRWEADARPGVHLQGPQGLIDELMDIEQADLVVGVFWKRFGTPTSDADSGTEHELRRAWACWEERGRPEVMVYFCQRPYFPKAADELVQWARVLAFRETLPDQQLWWAYETLGQFERLLREHLTRFLLSRIPLREPQARGSAAPRLRFNLPSVTVAFTGRQDELDAIDEALAVGHRAVVTQSIAGLGGVGKSQLAARYVQQRTEDYDVVAWIRAEDGGIDDLAGLATTLRLPVEELSPGDRAQLALQWLGQGQGRWLLVLDNVASSEQLDKLLPRAGNGRVLVTSRDRSLRQFGPVLTLDVFDEDTATRYLTDRAGRPHDVAAARLLARSLGWLPLALSHAAAYCQTGTSFTEYRHLLGELPAHKMFEDHPELSYAQTVTSTWKTSIQVAGDAAALAPDVLAMAAYLAPDLIPKSLFDVLVDDGAASGRKRLADALNALARFSLATVDDETVGVHRLLQKVVRDTGIEQGDRTPALHALAALTNAFPSDSDLPSRWPVCEQLLPHTVALADAMSEPGESAGQLIDLLTLASGYLSHAEPGRRGVPLAQRTLTYAERLLGAEHPDTLSARKHLAIAYQEAGRNGEAIAIFEPLLIDSERILGPEHPAMLTRRNFLATAYQEARRNAEAIAIYEPLLAHSQRILGPDAPLTLTIRCGLARAYQEGGRSPEAVAMYEPLIANSARVLGPDHPDTLSARHGLVIAYRDTGRIDEALAIYEPLLADRERILGPEHSHTLHTRHGLANTYRKAGRTDQAIALYEPLLADRERILGADHPDTLATRYKLALTYYQAERVDDAVAIYEPLLADSERILGPEHPCTLATRDNLAAAVQGVEHNTC
jgi:tetratricopeptide (TPR) repeat protein